MKGKLGKDKGKGKGGGRIQEEQVGAGVTI